MNSVPDCELKALKKYNMMHLQDIYNEMSFQKDFYLFKTIIVANDKVYCIPTYIFKNNFELVQNMCKLVRRMTQYNQIIASLLFSNKFKLV